MVKDSKLIVKWSEEVSDEELMEILRQSFVSNDQPRRSNIVNGSSSYHGTSITDLNLGSGALNDNDLGLDDSEMDTFWDDLDRSTLDSLLEFTSLPSESNSLDNKPLLKCWDESRFKEVKHEDVDIKSNVLKRKHPVVQDVFETNPFMLPELSNTIKEHKKKKEDYTPPNNYYERYHLYPSLEYCPDTIKTWIYPMNYTFRDYQFNIVQRALYENILVSLPTGLGKTFIAAVVMYNYFRWFPEYKVIFIAPTKPLVSQQIEACYKICGINQYESIELTGELNAIHRVSLWKTKRVFYLTPQVLQNDLSNQLVDPMEISCVVFDEAHRAQGSYAYVKVVNKLYEHNPLIRILALSATPGRKISKIQSVINNLNIACIESRNDNSPDVKPFIFEKTIDKIIVPLSSTILELASTFKNFIIPSLKNLYQKNCIWSYNPDTIQSYKLILALNNFRSRKKEGWESGIIEGDFALCIAFLKNLELLKYYGITTFYSKLLEWSKPSNNPTPKYRKRIMMDSKFQQFIKTMETIKTQPNYISDYLSHPKLSYVSLYLESFFISQRNQSKSDSSSSKVMIFAIYRQVIEEIRRTISNLGPLIRPIIFIGQSNTKFNKGLKQKEQLEVISKFKEGEYNVLISTSIGEEGLDIGDIDLIICYDNITSPTRMLQRMGRTGRKHQGRVLLLLTKGLEEDCFNKSNESFSNSIDELNLNFFTKNPRMIPQHINPTCIKKHIIINHSESLLSAISNSNNPYELSKQQSFQLYNMLGTNQPQYPSLFKFISYQTQYSPIYQVAHSKRTKLFVHLINRIKLGDLNTNSFHQSTLSESLPIEPKSNYVNNYQLSDDIKRYPPKVLSTNQPHNTTFTKLSSHHRRIPFRDLKGRLNQLINRYHQLSCKSNFKHITKEFTKDSTLKN